MQRRRADVQLDFSAAADGKRQFRTYTNNPGTYPGYDRFGRVITQTWVDGGYTTGTGSTPNIPQIVRQTYTYDLASNRLTSYDDRTGAKRDFRHFEYEYDGLDRLAEFNRGVRTASFDPAPGSQQWNLDMLGNWSSIANDDNGKVGESRDSYHFLDRRGPGAVASSRSCLALLDTSCPICRTTSRSAARAARMSASPILRLVHREQALHSLPELRDSQVMARIIQRRIALGRLVSQRLVQLGGARIEAAGLDLAAADAEASA